MNAIPWLIAAIFAIGCVYLWLVADEAEKREKGRERRIKRLEEQVRYWQADAAHWREAAMGPRVVWPEQVRNVWAKVNPN